MILLEVSNCEMLTYKSTKTSVAKVSSKGKIVAVAAGSCKISVKSQGVTSNITVIVLPNKVKTVASDFSSANIIQLKKVTTYKFRVRGFVKSGSKKYYGEFGKTYKLKTNK